MSIRKFVAANIRSERIRQNLSQEALAALAGLHRTYIGSVERGERNLGLDNLERIASALKVTPEVLVTQCKLGGT